MTTPSGVRYFRCAGLELKHATMSAQEIEYINAQAPSTIVGDTTEAWGIAKVFGGRLFVSSTRSMTGHKDVAAGSNELSSREKEKRYVN